MKMKYRTSMKINVIFVVVTALALVLSACGGGATPAPTQDTAMIQTQAAQTVVAELHHERSSAPTRAPPPTARGH